LRNLLVASTLGSESDLLDVPADRRARYVEQAKKFGLGDLYRLVDYVRDFLNRLRWSTQPLMDAQMLAVRAARMDHTVEFETILDKLDTLLQQGGVSGRPNTADLFSPVTTTARAVHPSPQSTHVPAAEKGSAPLPPLEKTRAQRDDAVPGVLDESAAARPTGTQAGEEVRERILARIRRRSAVVAGFLTNARIMRGEGGAVEVTVYHGNGYVQKQLAQKSVSNMIQAEVAAEMGQGLHVRLHVHSGAPPDERGSARLAEEQQDAGELLQSDEKLRMIVEKFDAEILPDSR
jgi:DNA polymerase III gamma/tau subunit